MHAQYKLIIIFFISWIQLYPSNPINSEKIMQFQIETRS